MPGIEKTMREFKAGTLHASYGGKVKSRKQAIAIGLSEERREGRHGKKKKRSAQREALREMMTGEE